MPLVAPVILKELCLWFVVIGVEARGISSVFFSCFPTVGAEVTVFDRIGAVLAVGSATIYTVSPVVDVFAGVAACGAAPFAIFAMVIVVYFFYCVSAITTNDRAARPTLELVEIIDGGDGFAAVLAHDRAIGATVVFVESLFREVKLMTLNTGGRARRGRDYVDAGPCGMGEYVVDVAHGSMG